MTGDRSATTADVEKSIQIALDAADAAMDVTSEYAKVAQQIKKSTLKLSGIEKLGRTSMIIGFVASLGAVALSIVIFMQASSQLKLLTATNTELLTVFVENVDNLNVSINKLEPALTELSQLRNSVETSNAALVSISEKSDVLSVEIAKAIAEMNTLKPMLDASILDMYEKTSIMNSELTLSFAEMTNEEFKAQNMIMGNFTKSVISALQTISDTSSDIKDQREALQSLQDVNAELSARISNLDKSLAAAKRSAAQAKARANANAKAAQDKSEDVIKFP